MSRYYEHHPLASLAQIKEIAAQHAKVAIFTCHSVATSIEVLLKDSQIPILSGFGIDQNSSLARNSLIVDAGLAERAVILVPVQWTHGYRLEGASAVVFAGVSINRMSRQYQQVIMRANAPQVDIMFAGCQIQPTWVSFDMEFVFGRYSKFSPSMAPGR